MIAHPSEIVQRARLLRPFNTERLDRALFHVEANVGSIRNRKMALLLKPPVDPAEWVFELTELMNSLETLADQCEEAWKRLDLLTRSAHGDYERAVDAMQAMLLGMREPEAAAS